ncbi:MAG: methionyl-tRNA formyltransferase [Chloroflexi bacterium]|nr:methionyl-tRNA formyltransferase [Chloroflexota bacterium]
MRVVFFGSPAFALPSVEALHAAGHDIALVVTQPDRPAGRGQKPTPPPVAVYAREKELRVWQTPSLRGEEPESILREARADAMVLVAFAALVPGNLLDLVPGGILNVHPSVLPRWRGAAPIQAALAAGDQGTGVSIIRLVEALDAGPILLQELVPIAPEDDYVTLEPRLAAVGANLVVRALREQVVPRPQDEAEATYSRRIEREDAHIDWTAPAETIFNQVRAYRGWPGAFTRFDARQLKVLRAWPADGPRAEPGTVEVELGVPLVATGERWLRLDEVQLEGRRAMSGADLLRGYPGLARSKLA